MTDEEIEEEAKRVSENMVYKNMSLKDYVINSRIEGAKFARGLIEPSILTDKKIEEEADKLFIIPYKEKEKGFGHITTKRECWVRGAKFFRGTAVSVLTNEEIEAEATRIADQWLAEGTTFEQAMRCRKIWVNIYKQMIEMIILFNLIKSKNQIQLYQ